MRKFGLAAVAAFAISSGAAQSATLLGEEVIFRFDLHVTEPPIVVGPGVEYSGFASPAGDPWEWTIDFDADSFLVSATTTEDVDFFFDPQLQFRSVTPGLIPWDPSKVTLTETSVSPGLASEDFGLSSTLFGELGLWLSFDGNNSIFVPADTTVRWAGTFDLPDGVIPLPAPALLLLTGIAGLAAAGARRRA